MKTLIKITNRLKFDYYDLMTPVDLEHEFTLNDIFLSIKNSKIEPVVLSKILQCHYVYDICKEAASKPFRNERDIDHLRLSIVADRRKYDGKTSINYQWSFDGVGLPGHIPDDLIENLRKNEIEKMKKEKWTQSYGVEFTPVYFLKGLPVKIDRKIHLTDWTGNFKKKKTGELYKEFDFTPSLTLLEVIYWIFWELSFCGSPEERDKRMSDVKERMNEFEKAKEEGRLDEVLIPWKDVKKGILDRIKKAKQAKKAKQDQLDKKEK